MSSLILLGLVGGGLYAFSRMRGGSALASHSSQGNAIAGSAALQTTRNDFPPGPLHNLVQQVLDSLSDPASRATLLAEAHGQPVSDAAHNLAIADLISNQEPLAWPLAQVTSALTPATAQAILTIPGARVDAFVQQAILQSSIGLGAGPIGEGLTQAQVGELVRLDAICRASVDVVREQLAMDRIDWIALDHEAARSPDPQIVHAVISRDPLPASSESRAAEHSRSVTETADAINAWAKSETGDPAILALTEAVYVADAVFWNYVRENMDAMRAASSAASRGDLVAAHTSFVTGRREFFAGDADDALMAAQIEETGIVDVSQGVSDIQAPGEPMSAHFAASDLADDNLPGAPHEEKPPITYEITAHTSAIYREGIPTDPTVVSVDVFDMQGDAEGRGSAQTMQWPPYPAEPPPGYHWERRPDLSDDSEAGRHEPWVDTWSEGSGTWTLVKDGQNAPGVD